MKAVKEKELRDLRRKTPQQLWIEDLDCFIESWDVSCEFIYVYILLYLS